MTPAAVATVVVLLGCGVVCGLVLYVVYRRRRQHIPVAGSTSARQDQPPQVEMEWDNSALSITVNPLDAELGGVCEYDEDEEEETGDAATAVGEAVATEDKKNELEWDDDATLSY
jgi:hypothetical protein